MRILAQAFSIKVLRLKFSYFILLNSFFVYSNLLSVAQPLDSIADAGKPKHLKSKAKLELKQGDYPNAIFYFKLYLQQHPNNYKISYKIAELYRLSRFYEYAQEWYKIAFDKSKETELLALYYYALMLKINGNCDAAKQYFFQFKTLSANSSKLNAYLQQANLETIACNTFIQKQSEVTSPFITLLDSTINKANSEHAPLLLDSNTFIYSSIRTNEKVYRYLHPDSLNTVAEQFYKAKFYNEKWNFEGVFDILPNDTSLNISNGSFSNDGKRFYFTYCENNWQNKIICSIFISTQQKDGSWTNPKKLNKTINIPAYTSTQPSVTSDLNTNNEIVYFVSNRPYGMGGLDIWYFIYNPQTETYSKPINAGKNINSAADEVTPYYHTQKHTLFFSSNGGINLGGFDIVKAIGEKNNFTPPQNLGISFNSTYDDLYYSSQQNEEQGFFVSNRKNEARSLANTTCCDDIYFFKKTHHQQAITKDTLQHIKETKTSAQQPFDTLTINNIYYQPQQFCLNKNAKAYIDTILLIILHRNPQLIIEIRGYADNTGTQKNNLNLSKKRAETISIYLQSKGIAKQRLLIKAFGETQATNTINKKQMAECRKTAFKIYLPEIKK